MPQSSASREGGAVFIDPVLLPSSALSPAFLSHIVRLTLGISFTLIPPLVAECANMGLGFEPWGIIFIHHGARSRSDSRLFYDLSRISRAHGENHQAIRHLQPQVVLKNNLLPLSVRSGRLAGAELRSFYPATPVSAVKELVPAALTPSSV